MAAVRRGEGSRRDGRPSATGAHARHRRRGGAAPRSHRGGFRRSGGASPPPRARQRSAGVAVPKISAGRAARIPDGSGGSPSRDRGDRAEPYGRVLRSDYEQSEITNNSTAERRIENFSKKKELRTPATSTTANEDGGGSGVGIGEVGAKLWSSMAVPPRCSYPWRRWRMGSFESSDSSPATLWRAAAWLPAA